MCWNKYVSLNTFIFSFIGICFLFYTSNYTPYKLDLFILDKPNKYWNYIGLFSIFTMQLIEYFIWVSIETKNKNMNKVWSIIGMIAIFMQPFSFIMATNTAQIYLRNIVLLLYIIFWVLYLAFKTMYKPVNISTSVAKNGHLCWDWAKNDSIIVLFIYLLFYSFYYFANQNQNVLILPLLIIIASFYDYNKYGTFGSYWCWLGNSFVLYYLFYVVFFLPFNEKKYLC
jgi:hypothetical protein